MIIESYNMRFSLLWNIFSNVVNIFIVFCQFLKGLIFSTIWFCKLRTMHAGHVLTDWLLLQLILNQFSFGWHYLMCAHEICLKLGSHWAKIYKELTDPVSVFLKPVLILKFFLRSTPRNLKNLFYPQLWSTIFLVKQVNFMFPLYQFFIIWTNCFWGRLHPVILGENLLYVMAFCIWSRVNKLEQCIHWRCL